MDANLPEHDDEQTEALPAVSTAQPIDPRRRRRRNALFGAVAGVATFGLVLGVAVACDDSGAPEPTTKPVVTSTPTPTEPPAEPEPKQEQEEAPEAPADPETERAQAVMAALAEVQKATEVAVASPNASPELLTALTAATEKVRLTVDGLGTTTTHVDLIAAQADLVAAREAVASSQAQWRAAEDQRVAEAQAAQAAAEKAAARAAQIANPDTRCAAPSEQVVEKDVAALGKAINALRAKHGRPALQVVAAGGVLGEQAHDMAQAGGIWGGKASITGCSTSPQGIVDIWAANQDQLNTLARLRPTTLNISLYEAGGWYYTAVSLT